MSEETIRLSFRLEDLDIEDDIARYSMPVADARRWAQAILCACDDIEPSALPVLGEG